LSFDFPFLLRVFPWYLSKQSGWSNVRLSASRRCNVEDGTPPREQPQLRVSDRSAAGTGEVGRGQGLQGGDNHFGN
jgi:hypothetical protein